ncbi:MAG: hypothetical protein WCA76_04765 [Candidatus Sulfotelmatobacter sp.]|jgi:hypothetical protein
MVTAPTLAPEEEELAVEKRTVKLSEPKPPARKQPSRNLLSEIFEGHEEFLGLTPD